MSVCYVLLAQCRGVGAVSETSLCLYVVCYWLSVGEWVPSVRLHCVCMLCVTGSVSGSGCRQ